MKLDTWFALLGHSGNIVWPVTALLKASKTVRKIDCCCECIRASSHRGDLDMEEILPGPFVGGHWVFFIGLPSSH